MDNEELSGVVLKHAL